MSPGYMFHYYRIAVPTVENLWSVDWETLYANVPWNWQAVFENLLSSTASQAPSPRVTAPPGCTHWEPHQAQPLFQRLWLRCAEQNCPARYCSAYCLHHDSAFSEAEAAGWYKPSSKSWNQGARCSEHKWERSL